MTDVIGKIPYRMALAGGWIDQPFVSAHNPDPDGSMVVVSLIPEFPFMDRCGMATSSRKVAERIWSKTLPAGSTEKLVRLLYEEENGSNTEPSGSQDMIGIIYPGISRLDYSINNEGGYFPVNIESCNDRKTAAWLERNINVIPIAQRPNGYNPLEIKNLDPEWISRLGKSGRDCYDAILDHDRPALGRSMNDSMLCWETILPGTVVHPSLTVDLRAILSHYQERYDGAMFSGCGGGYLYVVSEEDVPGGSRVKVRTEDPR
ncbi:MAG: hypothetical protein JEZ04_17790 [Spirochaetales bacterium]|nr:hypothetical protein [Spirochaetales bacterium]